MSKNIYVKRIESAGTILLILFLASFLGALGTKALLIVSVPIAIMWFMMWGEIKFRHESQGNHKSKSC